MARHILKKRAQAMLELAVFGSLFLFTLGVLVQYGFRLNSRQEMMMKSYRHAMRKASSDGIGDTYLDYGAAYVKDIAVPDVSSPYGIGRLATVASGASAKRTYFMMNQDEGGEETLPRMHYIINDRERSEYQNDPTVDGFKTSGYLGGEHLITEDTGAGPEFVIIRTIYDPQDNLAPQNIYWTWIKITINRLTAMADSHNSASDEKFEDLFRSGGATGQITNLGIDIMNPLNIPVTEDELFRRIREDSVITAGVVIHSSCLANRDNPYSIDVLKVYDDGKIDVKGAYWGEINNGDVAQTARRLPNQGLQPEEDLEINRGNMRVINEKHGDRFTTQTPLEYQEKVTRNIDLNSPETLEIESVRDINETKYDWEARYQ
ncbi:hypothetical protein ACFL2W_00780 [Candidatus Omnitrophota bacterium]